MLMEDCPDHSSYFLFGHFEHERKLLIDIIKHPIDDPWTLFLCQCEWASKGGVKEGTVLHTDLQDKFEAQKTTQASSHNSQKSQCLLFFDFLWERCGDRDRDLDFFEDFLGVLDLDLRDLLGVLGGEGDLKKKKRRLIITLSFHNHACTERQRQEKTSHRIEF